MESFFLKKFKVKKVLIIFAKFSSTLHIHLRNSKKENSFLVWYNRFCEEISRTNNQD